MVVDKLAEKHNALWKKPKHKLFSRPNYVQAQLSINGRSFLLIKPLTYMNESGVAVKQALGDRLQALGDRLQALGSTPSLSSPTPSHSNPPTLVVISDEFQFPIGRTDLKRGGSAGGHNGLQSVIDELGTTDFWRLRCGIGREFAQGELVEYVLSPFPEEQEEAVRQMIDDALLTIEKITPGASLLPA